jgi:outer membrane usher protein FimD/PapC
MDPTLTTTERHFWFPGQSVANSHFIKVHQQLLGEALSVRKHIDIADHGVSPQLPSQFVAQLQDFAHNPKPGDVISSAETQSDPSSHFPFVLVQLHGQPEFMGHGGGPVSVSLSESASESESESVSESLSESLSESASESESVSLSESPSESVSESESVSLSVSVSVSESESTSLSESLSVSVSTSLSVSVSESDPASAPLLMSIINPVDSATHPKTANTVKKTITYNLEYFISTSQRTHHYSAYCIKRLI